MPTNEMKDDFMVDFVRVMLNGEIANPHRWEGNVAIVTFPDGQKARIIGKRMTGEETQVPINPPLPPKRSSSYAHVLEHDYGFLEEPQLKELHKLTLRNIDDCRVYFDDACRTQLVADYRDFVLTFETGDKFLLAIVPVL